MTAAITFAVDEMTAREQEVARAIVSTCRELLADYARHVSDRTGIAAVDVVNRTEFRELALSMLEEAAATFGAGHGCRRDALRAAMNAAMAGAL